MVEYLLHTNAGRQIAEITSVDHPMCAAEDFLDVVANIPARALILEKRFLDERFFDLASGIAGEILQKVSNYFLQLAIVGDFSTYTSKSLKAFIQESNRGNQVVFVPTKDEALRRLGAG